MYNVEHEERVSLLLNWTIDTCPKTVVENRGTKNRCLQSRKHESTVVAARCRVALAAGARVILIRTMTTTPK